MPRVLFFTSLTLWSMGKGHGGPAFTQTVKRYIDEGWEVFLISDEASNKEYPYLDSDHNIIIPVSVFRKYTNIKKIGLLFRWLDHFCMTRKFIRKGSELLKQKKDDTILYAYEIFGVKACSCLSKKASVPFVSRFQGTILSQYKNNLVNRISRYPHYQALSEKSDLVIMTDDGTLGNKVLNELENNSTTLFLRNGLDLMSKNIDDMIRSFDRFAFRSQLGVSEDETMFLTVSRLVDWKKVDRAIDGFSAFCKNGGHGKLVIVGDGSSRATLEQKAADLKIKDRVIFVGSVAHDSVYDYMMACDIFLSLYDLSNIGNPLLEAMALGTCIITLDVGDTASLISNYENGILLTMKELPQLNEVMMELSTDAALRKRLGKAAYKYAKESFKTWKERMDLEINAVRSLME